MVTNSILNTAQAASPRKLRTSEASHIKGSKTNEIANREEEKDARIHKHTMPRGGAAGGEGCRMKKVT